MIDLNEENKVDDSSSNNFISSEEVNKLLTFFRKVPVKYYFLSIPVLIAIQLLFIVSSILESVPLFGQTMEVIGFYVSVRFLVKRALKQKDRQELIKEVKEKASEFI